jgi:hypothetical protein
MVRMDIRKATLSGALAAIFGSAVAVMAQPVVNGPPIDPSQVFQAQPRPTTTLPPPTVTAPGAPTLPTVSRPIPHGNIAQDRAAYCQHQAGVERIRKRKRGAYIHNCMQGN